jgi:hypothetical protein
VYDRMIIKGALIYYSLLFFRVLTQVVVIRLLCEWLFLVILCEFTNKCFAFDFLAYEIVFCSWNGGAEMKARLLLSSFFLV